MSEVTLPAAVQSIQERFAREMVFRSFRVMEAAAVLNIDAAQAFELIKDPETQAHITRIASTGNPAKTVPDARSLIEEISELALMPISDFIKYCEMMPGKGQQNLAGFMAVKVAAIEAAKKMLFPSPEGLLRKYRKRAMMRGEAFDVPKNLEKIRKLMTDTEHL